MCDVGASLLRGPVGPAFEPSMLACTAPDNGLQHQQPWAHASCYQLAYQASRQGSGLQ